MKKPLKKIGYGILSGLLHGLARLPFAVLYFVSDMLFVLVYYVVRYRRNVVASNLRRAFPEMTDCERRAVARQFYRNFTDNFIETIKLFHVKSEEIKRRLVFEDLDTIKKMLDANRSVVIYFSHCGNWEWVPSLTLWLEPYLDRTVISQVYRPLRNKWSDELFLKLRARFGSQSFPKRLVLRRLLEIRRDGKLFATGFMSDQKPSHGDPTYPTRFLGIPTAMITGTETLTRKLDAGACYLDMHKVSRGHYKVVVRYICTHPDEMEPMAITERYTRMLEETIRREPAIWLWTHKRWKRKVVLPDEDSNPTTDQ